MNERSAGGHQSNYFQLICMQLLVFDEPKSDKHGGRSHKHRHRSTDVSNFRVKWASSIGIQYRSSRERCLSDFGLLNVSRVRRIIEMCCFEYSPYSTSVISVNNMHETGHLKNVDEPKHRISIRIKNQHVSFDSVNSFKK